MATQDHVRHIENLISHRFTTQSWATTALTAAGAEEFDHHGNRMSARYGRIFIEFYVLDNAHQARVPPAAIQDYTTDALRKSRHAKVARETGIEACMKFSPRQRDDPATDTTLSNAICAIIGAAWQDSHNIAAPFKAIEAFRLAEPKWLLYADLMDSQQLNLFQSSAPYQEDISWAIESAAITGNSTPLSLVNEPLSIPTEEMGVSISDLAICHPEPPKTSPFESLLHVYSDLESNTPVTGTNLQITQPYSAGMSSFMFLDTPKEIPGLISVEQYSEDQESNLNNSTAHTRFGSATSGDVTRGHENTAEITQQSNARKRKAPNTGQQLKRINSQQEQVPRGETERLQVEEFIEMEKGKCAKLGIPYDQSNYLSPTMTEWLTALKKEDEKAAVSMISTAIGSAESIALLKHILNESRAKERSHKPGEDLALVDRVREIQQLGSQIAFYQFLQRCHIWKLYADISREVGSQEMGFVVFTLENMNNQKGGKAGNPNNSRASEITNAMIRGLASEVDLNNREHQKQRRYYTKLRKLGQRLDLLTQTFGFGVLGLIQTQDSLETVDVGVRINDETILLPTDKTFQDCVHLLDDTQGNMIRSFSSVIEDVVRSIFNGTWPDLFTFPIEAIEQAQILSHPKGSVELLKLLSGKL